VKFENLDTNGEGDLFYAHVRSGQGLLRCLGALAVAMWLVVAYFAIVETDQDPVELAIAAAPMTVGALVAIPIVRLFGYGTVRVSVTSSFITLDHDSVKFGWDSQVEVRTGLEPQISVRTRTIGSGSKRKDVKRYSVTYGGKPLIGSLDRRGHAAAFADRLVRALNAVELSSA